MGAAAPLLFLMTRNKKLTHKWLSEHASCLSNQHELLLLQPNDCNATKQDQQALSDLDRDHEGLLISQNQKTAGLDGIATQNAVRFPVIAHTSCTQGGGQGRGLSYEELAEGLLWTCPRRIPGLPLRSPPSRSTAAI